MQLLNVSFGIFAFLPQGWVFMMLIILLEACIMSRVLEKKWLNTRIFVSALISNAVSGITGIVISMILNGGWWLVVWFPWVSSHEVDIYQPQVLIGLIIYYVAAMLLSVLIEWALNHLILTKKYPMRDILKGTLCANAVSYALGAVIITLLCI